MLRRMRGDDPLASSAALIFGKFIAKSAGNFAMKWRSRVDGSNPLCSSIQSVGFRPSRRIARNQRVCARFAITRGPGERLRRRESPESGKTYPGAILLGPWIITMDSPSIATTAGRRRTMPAVAMTAAKANTIAMSGAISENVSYGIASLLADIQAA
jgi:hypothetical protein